MYNDVKQSIHKTCTCIHEYDYIVQTDNMNDYINIQIKTMECNSQIGIYNLKYVPQNNTDLINIFLTLS